VQHKDANTTAASDGSDVDGLVPDDFVNSSLRQLLIDRRLEPCSDWLSLLATAEIDGSRLDLDLALECARLLMVGGLDTTAALLANTFFYLHENPRDKQRLIDQPDLVPSACEEFLRYFSPVINLARTVTEDCIVGDQSLAAGDRVALSWLSANRDERQFPDAGEVVLDRFPNRHVAFGVGTHRCVGSSLARREFEIAVPQLLRRIPDYVVDVTRARRYEVLAANNGWLTMPVTFDVPPRS
jgi:cytochrome P450